MPVASIPAQILERLWRTNNRTELIKCLRELSIACTVTGTTKYRQNRKVQRGFISCGQLAGTLASTYEQLMDEDLTQAERESVDLLMIFAKTKLTLDEDYNNIPKDAIAQLEHKLHIKRTSRSALSANIDADMAKLVNPSALIATPDPEDRMD